jgi:hypothetical protein
MEMRPVILLAAIASLASAASELHARQQESQTSVCLMLESAAQANGLPVEFFARVIWQESRFDAGAVGPVTRSGTRAQGIAQFMPGTAAERQLLDPFDPVQALPKAAEFLRELRAEFGNLGLAAAAYNAGPRRLREWLAGTGEMPGETRRYVAAITGHDIEDWKDAQDTGRDFKPANCETLMALLGREPNAFVAALERRVRQGITHPWGVQLAAGFSRAKALSAYARAIKRLDSVLGDRDPLILQHLLRSRGTRPIYQVRVGADTRAEADRLCGRIRAARGACIVLRNDVRRG